MKKIGLIFLVVISLILTGCGETKVKTKEELIRDIGKRYDREFSIRKQKLIEIENPCGGEVIKGYISTMYQNKITDVEFEAYDTLIYRGGGRCEYVNIDNYVFRIYEKHFKELQKIAPTLTLKEGKDYMPELVISMKDASEVEKIVKQMSDLRKKTISIIKYKYSTSNNVFNPSEYYYNLGKLTVLGYDVYSESYKAMYHYDMQFELSKTINNELYYRITTLQQR